ncbi:MAG: response regulator transcription factor [Sphaerochaetaceae bacterium]
MLKNKRIMVVDDEQKIVRVLEAYLQKEGFEVLKAYSGKDAIEIFSNTHVDLIILDLMLLDISGEQVCKQIRKTSRVPIIMLTAKTTEEDLLKGLDLGADDYIFKPFSPRTVIAKTKAVLRRVSNDALMEETVQQGNLIIDFSSTEVKKDGKKVLLTPTEFKILLTLAKAPGRTFTREQLIEFALEGNFDGFDRSIDTYIKSLRKKLEEDRKNPKFIITVRGMGYRFGGVQ